ncbi:MAG: hypothetical protein FJY29_02245 [Betaproteobacteria bacterium]|nr:hypothetical protein [Betaproteobacteria bacterium]
MKSKRFILLGVLLAGLVPACVSSRQEDPDANVRPVGQDELYGVIYDERENYPWLSSKHDKGIYSTNSPNAPFGQDPLEYSNLKKKIQKTSKKKK